MYLYSRLAYFIVLTLMLTILFSGALGAILHYWVIIAIAGLFLTTTALAAHILIELPGIRMGQAIIRRLTENQPIKPAVPH